MVNTDLIQSVAQRLRLLCFLHAIAGTWIILFVFRQPGYWVVVVFTFIFCSTSCITSGHQQACLAITPVSGKEGNDFVKPRNVLNSTVLRLTTHFSLCFRFSIIIICVFFFFLRNYFIFLPLLKFSKVICRWSVRRSSLDPLNLPFEKVEETDIWPGYLLHCEGAWTLHLEMSVFQKGALVSRSCSQGLGGGGIMEGCGWSIGSNW